MTGYQFTVWQPQEQKNYLEHNLLFDGGGMKENLEREETAN